MTRPADVQTFALQLGLGPVPVSLDEAGFGRRFEDFEPRLIRGAQGAQLSLTVEANDLWLAVLSAMAAMAETGYTVEWLDARPTNAPRA